jgi:Lrp/AsnC family leucine-responsive transcriptional regulator
MSGALDETDDRPALVTDGLDLRALRHLQRCGRATWAELAGILGLSAPAAAERVHRLEERGAIRGFAALLAPEAAGCGLLAFIAVTLERPRHRAAFLARVQELPEILECHHVAGDDDYLLKVRCRGARDLDRLLIEGVKSLPGVVRTRTTMALATVKETTELPLARLD